MNTLLRPVLLAGALVASTMAAAQDFPSRQVTVVIPFPPGGSNDTVGRYMAEALAGHWGETVVIENRPGAGSAIGSAYVSKADPDGHTLLFVSGSYTTNAAMQDNLPFDPVADLLPVAMAGIGDRFLITGSRVPLPALADIEREAKAQTIFFGTAGVGTMAHLTGAVLNDALGVEMEAVHYPGGADAMLDLGGGRIDIFTGSAVEAQSGVGTPVAVLSAERSALLPDLPTVVEAGYPDAQVSTWWGVFAPAGTPDGVLDEINAAVRRVMSTPEATEFLAGQASRPSDMSVAEVTDHVQTELERWRALVEKHGIGSN